MTADDRRRRAAAARIAAATAAAPDPETLYAGLVSELAAVMPVRSACWHLCDPVTGVLTRTGVVAEPPGSYEHALELEFLRDDVAGMAEVARRPRPVAVLSQETAGAPRRSPRYREMLEPDGARDEMRVAFADPFGVWGSLVLFGDGRFAPADADLLAAVSASVAQGLRTAAARSAGGGATVPAVLLLAADGALEAADAGARSLLDHLTEGTGGAGLPGVVHVLAAQARLRDPARPARARVQTRDGRWLLLDATPLDEGERPRVAVVAQPAPAESLIETLLRAHGLTPREREVTLLVLAGAPTDAIAARLHLSPWTVQDHLKAVFEKVGVASRRALVARIATESGRPR